MYLEEKRLFIEAVVSFVANRRKEELELFLYGTIVRPDIVVFTPPNLEQHIKFETTAVGLKRQLFFEVYNTSGRTVLLNHSFFDAPETYFAPVKLPLDQVKFYINLIPIGDVLYASVKHLPM